MDALLFVYGTLKRGCCNHRHLAGQRFVGPARTVPGFTLYDLGGYPGLAPAPEDTAGVAGEIWAVDAAGHKLWEYDSGTLFFASTPVLTENGLIYLISRNTSIYALSAAGQLAGLWEQVLDAPTASINLLPDGALVAGGLGPRFYAFKATNALAQTAWPMFLGNRRHTSNAADHP